jgi:hypothetical protein
MVLLVDSPRKRRRAEISNHVALRPPDWVTEGFGRRIVVAQVTDQNDQCG